MSVYHLLVYLILFFAFLFHGNLQRNSKFILIAMALMFCVYGLRDAYSIGNDSSSSYLHQFESMEDTSWDELPGFSIWINGKQGDLNQSGRDRNIGLPWLMKTIYVLSDGEYQWVVSIIALFVMIAVTQFVYSYSTDPLQSVLLFLGLLLFTFHFNALKQSIAMALVLISFNAIIRQRLVRFLIAILAASLFHLPALVFLPAYWIAKMRLGRNYLIMLAMLLVLTYLFRDRLVDWMTDNYDTVINENSGMRYLSNKVLVMLVIIVAALVVRPPHPRDRMYCVLLQLFGVATVIQTFAAYNNTFERLADYYFQFSIVFIPMIFEVVETDRVYLQQRTLQFIRLLGPYIICLFAIWRFLDSTVNDATIYPYRFYFQSEHTEKLLTWINQ